MDAEGDEAAAEAATDDQTVSEMTRELAGVQEAIAALDDLAARLLVECQLKREFAREEQYALDAVQILRSYFSQALGKTVEDVRRFHVQCQSVLARSKQGAVAQS